MFFLFVFSYLYFLNFLMLNLLKIEFYNFFKILDDYYNFII